MVQDHILETKGLSKEFKGFVAVSGVDRFGSTESNITARLPLMVRPSAPRFANFGDSFELPVVVQNQSDAPMDVEVVLQTANLTGGDTGKVVNVPANDRVEVRFPVATDQAGTATFRAAAVSGEAADAATVSLPVYTPATAEAFATYGVIDDGATLQPLLAPTGVRPEFGGLEVSTSSTALQSLTDAILYLEDYPYDSADAYASRIVAIASLKDVLDAFDAEGLPSPDQLDARVRSDIAALVAKQNGEGGFGYWSVGRSDPFVSLQAAHALVAARDAGYAVPQQALDMALGQYAANIEQYFESWYGQETRDSLSSYALYVRNLGGQGDGAKAEQLWSERGEDLALDAMAWLWPSLGADASSTIERVLQNRAVDTAGAATFTNAATDDSYVTLQSDRRTDAIVLDALITQAPQSDLIPKVVAGLLGGRTKGRWDSVQENSFVLMALKRYYDTFEGVTPEFVAGVWLGDRFAGSHDFTGHSTDRVRLDIPTADLIAAGDTDVVIGKEGAGRLYYRIGLRYAPDSLTLDPLDRGFVVQRTYEAVDDPADVVLADDGTWHVKAGARVRVRLTMVAESQRTHVALVDPMPAGFEALNPALATSPDVPADTGIDGKPGGLSWWWTWYDHQNLRDDRVEAFSTVLGGGTYDYSYIARATTPGSFVVPPTRAEEMYAPETFGRSGTASVVVEA